uniref:Uncharacterized protein n=1 Tax=Romanomermis culicivorax TaxID=13658 RepID=A0A915HSZ2_ROMCU
MAPIVTTIVVTATPNIIIAETVSVTSPFIRAVALEKSDPFFMHDVSHGNSMGLTPNLLPSVTTAIDTISQIIISVWDTRVVGGCSKDIKNS